MEDLQALYNENANNMIEQVAQEEGTKRKFSSLIVLATTTMAAKDTKSMENEPQIFKKARNHPYPK